MLLQSEWSLFQSTENIYLLSIHIFCIPLPDWLLVAVEYETRKSQALKGHKIHHNLSTTNRYLLRFQSQNLQATIKRVLSAGSVVENTGCDSCVIGSEGTYHRVSAHNQALTYEAFCTAPEMIPTPKWSPTLKWSQIDPEMIPTPKWSPFFFLSTLKWSPRN